MNASQLITTCILALGTVLSTGAATPGQATVEDPVLVRIGEETITASDLDSLLARSHGVVDLERLAEQSGLQRILDKEIRDRLILTDAAIVGIDQDDEVLAPVRRDRDQRAARLLLRDLLPDEIVVSEDSVQSYFQRFYRTVTLRQVSVRLLEEADSLRSRILDGAEMDSLARERSLDSHRVRDGLIATRDWADVENVIRRAIAGLKIGEISAPFPNREAWSIVRVEDLSSADPKRLAELRPMIESRLRKISRRARARALVDSLARTAPVIEDRQVFETIAAESDQVLRGSFRRPSPQPALWIDEEHVVREHDLRSMIAQAAMANAEAPFDSLLDQSVRQARSDLILRTVAERDGYLQKPVVVRGYENAKRQAVITAYLKEFVADKIRFKRDDFEEFYREHREDFRGPDEVQLSMLIYDTQKEADTIVRRLEDGADFDYLREHTQPGWKASSAKAIKWTPVSSFSEDITTALGEMEVGDHSTSLPLGKQGWMVLRLDGRRAGRVPTLDEVQMPIREQIYRREFSAILDDVLARLEDAVGVTRYEDRIREYFQPTR